MKFLGEVTESVQVITEEVENTGKKDYYIQGIFMQCDIKNRNGRTYPLGVVSEEVNRFKSSMIATKRALGELGHPAGPTVNLDKVSHMITDLWVEGNNFMGKAKILDTPMGKIVKNLIDEGVTLGVSSRGLGNVVEQNGQKFVKDFFLSTVDIVSDPSGPNAFVHAIMEDKEYSFDANGNIVEKAMDNAVVTAKIADHVVTEERFGHKEYSKEYVMKKIRDGEWDSQEDIKAGKSLTVVDVDTRKKQTIYIKEEAVNENALLESFAAVMGVDLQELSKGTLKSYAKKAAVDSNSNGKLAVRHGGGTIGSQRHEKMAKNRIKGISRAVDKLDDDTQKWEVKWNHKGKWHTRHVFADDKVLATRKAQRVIKNTTGEDTPTSHSTHFTVERA